MPAQPAIRGFMARMILDAPGACRPKGRVDLLGIDLAQGRVVYGISWQ